jgi:hypothetical protein
MVGFSRRVTQVIRGRFIPAASYRDRRGPSIIVVHEHLKFMRGRSYPGERMIQLLSALHIGKFMQSDSSSGGVAARNGVRIKACS